MDYPEKFESGFDIKAIIGAIFTGFVMMPGAIYLSLIAGATLGGAAQWTIVILFTEVARRSFVTLRKQEVYILLYVAGALASGGAFAVFINEQYFVQSPPAKGLGISGMIPPWAVPGPHSEALLRRTFFHSDWLLPILIMLFGQIAGRLNWFGLGYILFRVTADYEKLPFPMAAVSAQGSTALAEASSKEETWRWRTFSIGAMIGIVFAAFYIGIPTITGAIMTKPLQLLPIPWVDLTRSTETILPATPTGFVCDLGTVMWGFVAPFWSVVGGFVMALSTFALNPWLQRHGYLPSWKPGMDTIQTGYQNSLDFYLSLGVGVSIAVALIGFYTIARQAISASAERKRQAAAGEVQRGSFWQVPEGRGDGPLWFWYCLAAFVVSTIGYIVICCRLIPNFPLLWVTFFGLIYSPLTSYVDARMQGLIGQGVGIPMAKEAAFILSKYKGIDIWFAPIPMTAAGGTATSFRVIELVGCKFPDVIKAELTILPLTIVCSFIFWQFIWRLAPIPSSVYPYAQKIWYQAALQRGLWMTMTMGNQAMFTKAWSTPRMFGGIAFGVSAYAVLASLHLPILFVYGVVNGLGAGPHGIFPMFAGALISQFYFTPRFGARRWKQYATVIMAGYSCGFGLIGMGTCAIAMITKSVSTMPY